MTESLHKYKVHYLLAMAVGLIVIFGLLGGLGDQAGALSAEESVEISITSVSPIGLSGGLAIPASCPSDAHCALDCTSCTSSANACGQTNTGTFSCPSVCSATTPPNPPGYGTACVSAPNICGMKNSGAIGCSGCSVTTPSDSLCPLPPEPDLTATDPATADALIAESPIIFNGDIVNVGSADAGGPFDNKFQFDTNDNGIIGDGITEETVASPIASLSSVAPGNMASVSSGPQTFLVAGDIYVRLCADLLPTDDPLFDPNGVVAEGLNENNNCSSWVLFTIDAAPVIEPPALLFFPDDSPIPFNTTTNLNWDTSGGGPVDSCTASGDWFGSKAAGGGTEPTGDLIVDQTYNLQCTGPSGLLSPFRTVTVNVLAEPLAECEDGDDNDMDGQTDFPDDPGCTSADDNSEGDVTIDANPNLIRSGDSSSVSWSSGGTPESCIIEGPGISSTDPDNLIGLDTGPLTEQSTYTITCIYEGGEEQAESTVVIVLPKIIEI